MTSAAGSLRAALAADPEAVEKLALTSCATEADAKHFCEIVFKEPLEFNKGISTIPKATLVVGAGKLERAKYEEDLPKWVTSALRDLGYKEDRGASALLACAGSYKFQHDTGKNEKFVQVFPLIKVKEAADEGGGDDGENANGEDELQGREKAEWLCIISDPATFKEMVNAKMGTWSCKRRALNLIKEKDEELKRCEEKLQTRVALTPQEQKLFDSADRTALEEKMGFLRSEMIKMVDEDKLTKKERELALEQMQTRLKELPESAGKQLESIRGRIAHVESKMNEKSHRIPLKHEDRMRQLWKKTLSMEKLAEKAGPKGRWNTALSAAEVKALGEKEDMENEINSLAQQSRFWFEEDDELAFRVQGAKALVKPAAGGSSSSSSAKVLTNAKPAPSSANTWQPVGKAGGRAWGGAGAPSVAKSKQKSAFAGLADDSDSD